MSERSREALPKVREELVGSTEVREALQEVCDGSGGLAGGPGCFVRPSWQFGEGSGGPRGGLGGVRGHSQSSAMGQEAFPEFWEGLEGPPRVLGGFGRPHRGPGDFPGGLGWVGSPCRRFGRGRKALWRSRSGLKPLPEFWEGSGSPLRGPGGVGRPSQWSARPSQRSRGVGNPCRSSGTV